MQDIVSYMTKKSDLRGTVHADLGRFCELLILCQNLGNDTGNKKALVCWSYFSCNSNYILELSAYGNRVGNTLSWVINAVQCLYFTQNYIFKTFSCLKKMVIIRTDPHRVWFDVFE